MALSRWTDEADATLRRLWATGPTAEAIAERLGYLEARTITRRAERIGLPPRETAWTDDRIATLRRMIHGGFSFSEIGEALGITRNAAIGKAHRLGLSSGSPEGNAQAAKARQKREEADRKRAARATKGQSPVTATIARRHGPIRGVKPAGLTLAGFVGLSQGKPTPPRLDIIAASETPALQPALQSAVGGRVHFFDRPAGARAWPLWKAGAARADLFCCGAPAMIGGAQPYCAEHMARSRTAAPRKTVASKAAAGIATTRSPASPGRAERGGEGRGGEGRWS